MAGPALMSNDVEMILQNMDQLVNITIYDENGNLANAATLALTVMNRSKTVLYQDSLVTPSTRLVNSSTGKYYIDWGDPTAPENTPSQTETNTVQDLLFIWRATVAGAPEAATVLQVVKVIDPRVLAYLPYFRLQIDKAVKIVDPNNDIFLGYTDAQLLMYLEGGLNVINLYQPSTSILLEGYPFQTHGQLLIDTATLVALQSQTLFAVDTDINYSDQGYSFNIGHVQPLQSFLGFLQQRLDRLVPLFKLNFATMGSIHLQAGVSFRLLQLMQAAPSGILFRGFLST